jgi:ABC-type sugar transport system substrate-binding protein
MGRNNRRPGFRHLAAIAIVATAFTAIAVMGASAASSHPAAKSASPPKETIGYVDIFSSGAMQQRWYNFFTAATKQLGWTVIDKSANGVTPAALAAVRNFVASHVNAIVVSCVDTGPLRPGLEAAHAAHIPVIALGCQNGPPNNAWDATYAESDPQLARTLGAYVVSQLKAKGITEASVLQDRTILVGRLRSDYFISTLRKAGIKLVTTPVIPETSIVPSTDQAVRSTLSAYPNVGAFIPVFDFSVGPAVQTLGQLGKSSSVAIYSYYADLVNLPLMLKPGSPIKGLVDGPVEQVSLVAIDQLLHHFMTGKPVDRNAGTNLHVKYVIFTPANHPPYAKSYVTPWSSSKYLAPYVAKWNKEYGFSLKVP